MIKSEEHFLTIIQKKRKSSAFDSKIIGINIDEEMIKTANNVKNLTVLET